MDNGEAGVRGEQGAEKGTVTTRLSPPLLHLYSRPFPKDSGWTRSERLVLHVQNTTVEAKGVIQRLGRGGVKGSKWESSQLLSRERGGWIRVSGAGANRTGSVGCVVGRFTVKGGAEQCDL